MPEVGSASLAIIPSFKGFQGDLERGSSKALTAAGATGGDKFGDSAGKAAGSKFKSHVKNFAKIAAVGLGLAGAAAFKFAGDAVEEAREAQKVGALTESTIKATGKAARVTAKHVGDLSGKISEKVGIDDEAIQSGANMLLTFKNIRNEAGEGNKIFDQTLTTLVDMSSAMGTDAKTSAIQLGKALNDPIKGVSALSRVGVTFTDQQKNQIKALVEAGNVMGAQKIVLRELKSEFGGAAKAQATEADKLSVAWGNFKEEIGTQLLPVMDDLAIFLRKKGIPAAKDFAGWVRDDMIPAAKDAYEEMKPLIGGVKDLAKFINDLPKPAKIAGIAAVLGGIGYAKLRGGGGGGGNGGGGALGTIGKAVGLAKPIKTFETNPAALGGGKGGVPVPTGPGAPGKGGLAAFLKGGATPAVAAILNKYLNDWFKSTFEPKGGPKGDPGKVVSNIKLGEKAPFSDAVGKWVPFMDTAGEAARKAVEKADGALADLVNGGNVKEAREQFRALKDEARQQGVEIDVLKAKFPQYASAIKQIPEKHMTEFLLPNFLEQFNRIRQYGSMLDGLDGRTVTTFLKSVRTNNDIGESGDPRFGGFRAHGGAMHPGYSYMVGENGPERVTVGARSTVEPNAGGETTFVLMLDGEALDYRMRRVADDRYNANRHHPTGRRR